MAAKPANAQSFPSLIAKSSIPSSQRLISQQLALTPATATCKPGSSKYNRFSSCGRSAGSIRFYIGNKVVGHISFLADQTDLLAAKSVTVTEKVDIHNIVVSGETESTAIGLTATCGPGCKGASHAPVALKAGASYQFNLYFVNSIKKNVVRFATPTYKWNFSVGGDEVTHGQRWRCDGKLNERAGCVYASYVPEVTSLARLKFVAASIRSVEARGGPQELHRNSFLTASNRNAVCDIKLPPGWKPPSGWPLPVTKSSNKPTCDEYPFDGSVEGGKHFSAAHRGTAWVPAGENASQGALLNAFYLTNRVLDAASAKTKGDLFYVVA